MYIKNFRKKILEMTPIGKADNEVKKYIKNDFNKDYLLSYQRSLFSYRRVNILQAIINLLFYNSIVISILGKIGI